MYRRLAALLGIIGFILVAGYWAVRMVAARLAGEHVAEAPDIDSILLRALLAMAGCFVVGYLLSRHAIGMLEEAHEDVRATQVMVPTAGHPSPEEPAADAGPSEKEEGAGT